LGVKPHSNVKVKEVLNDFDLTTTQRHQLPNLVIGFPINVVARLQIPALDEDSQILTLRLAWDDPKQPSRQVLKTTFTLPVVSAEQLGDFPAVPEVEEQVALLMAARARQEAIHFSDLGDYEQAQESLRQAQDQIAMMAPSPSLVEDLELLSDLAQTFSAGNIAEARKKSVYQRYNRQRSRPTQPDSQS
jgi:Ca-activated chloride channel homolog